MAVEKFYRVEFTVEGTGRFPVDMLRYDRCCPATEQDSNFITMPPVRLQSMPVSRRVNLVRFSSAGKSGPTAGRWESFGWRVVEVKYHDGVEVKYHDGKVEKMSCSVST